jgi:tetratricopeptide (TPR) repeat protein
MKPFAWPDSHHLAAAQGWLELGNHLEAFEELECITPQLRAHPHVLKLRWEIYAKARHWFAAMNVAAALVRLLPDEVDGWIHRSFALHELKRTAEARDLLLPAVAKFPKEASIPYNLACYETQLGNSAQGKEWLEKAFALDATKELKLQFLSDPDLEPLWKTSHLA